MTLAMHNPVIRPTLIPWQGGLQGAEAVDFEDWMLGRSMRPTTVTQRLAFADARLREWSTWDLRPSEIALWIGQHDGWTAVTYYNHLRCIYRWLTETNRVEHDPTEMLRRPPAPRPMPNPLDADEIDRLLDGAEGDLRSWIMLAMLAGLRAHEVAKIHGRDVTKRRIRVVGKGGKDEPVPTHPALWELAQNYPADDYWFPSAIHDGRPCSTSRVRGNVAQRFRDVGIDAGSIHRLRATYATQLLRAGVSTRVIQKLLRHSSLATTEHYLGVDEDELSAAIGLLAA